LQTQTKIANAALRLLGSTSRLVDVHPESESQHGRDIADIWDGLRDFYLKKHSGDFSIARARLNRTAPPIGCRWPYAYALPADCLKWLPPRRGSADWFDGEVEGNLLLTNAETVIIRYIRRVEPVAEWSPEFCMIMTVAIAEAMAEPVTQSKSIRQDMGDKLVKLVPTAKRMDALSSGQRRRGATVVRSDILAARNRYGTGFVRR
jgi:hypothetical protein